MYSLTYFSIYIHIYIVHHTYVYIHYTTLHYIRVNIGIAQGANTSYIYIQVDRSTGEDPYLEFIKEIADMPIPPSVVSIAFSTPESVSYCL